MSKGVAALAYLPQIDLVLPTGNAVASIESFKQLANAIAKMQAEELGNGTYTGVVARGNNPYDSSVWTIVITNATTFTCNFVSEVVNEELSATGRAALSARRKVDLRKVTTVNDCTVRSFLALLNFIEGLEDKVAQTGSGATGDATYMAIPLRGNTPFKTHEWTVSKLADLYAFATTANSN